VTLDVDVDGVPAGRLRLSGKSGVWRQTITAAAPPKTIELDARYDAMRRIAEADLPACLNTTLAAGEGQSGEIRFTEGVSDFEGFAKRIAAEKSFAVRPFDAAPPPTPVPSISLKVIRIGSTFSMSGADGKPVVTAADSSFEIAGKRYTNPKAAVLVSGFESGKPVTAFLALSDEAANRARMLGFYGWDQYVVFEAGQRKPVARGFLDRNPSGTRRAVVTDVAAARVAEDIERLASDDLAGRRPGTPGHEKAERLLLARLSELTTCECGSLAEVRSVPFALGVADLTSPRDLLFTTDAGTEVLHDAFRPLAGSPARELGSPLPFAEGAGAVPLPGKWPDTSPEGLARLWRQLNESTSAPAVLLAPTAAARAGLAPFLDTPSSLTDEGEAELRKPGHDGKPRARPSLPHWIAGRRMRAFPDAVPLRVPYLVLSDAAVERIDRGPAIRQIDFAIAWSPEAATLAAGKGGVNLVAEMLPEGAPKEKPPVVVLSAHYDSFGTVDGTLLRGADDNATGVAAVLEALRGLPESLASKKAKVGVVVALFDGEEWGLVGSRALAKQLAKDYDVRAVVNLDSIGRVRDDTAYVIGLTTHKDLGTKALSALEGVGFRLFPNIDKFAYAEGSDHWPFHALGTPAITLWASDYGVMNTAADEPDLVDPVGVARIAGAVRTLVERLVGEK
jgi:hypothetical protein